MTAHRVGSRADFDADRRVSLRVEGREIVAFRVGESYYAFENLCPHLGGPVCEGKLARRVEAELRPDDTFGERFSREHFHIVCPWHGFEYDLETGVALADERFSLRRFEVAEEEGDVYVHV